MNQPHESKPIMVSKPEQETSPTPKLSLYSLPKKPPEPPGLLTPPLQTMVSIPFDWEEAPGKPKATDTATAAVTTTTQTKPKAARCLELPPRLLNEAKVTDMSSPTTVLDGPYVGRSLSSTFSFRIGGSFRIGDSFGKKLDKGRGHHLGSWRWGGLKENEVVVVEDSFDFSPLTNDGLADNIVNSGGGGGGSGGESDQIKVKITRARRGSFLNISHTRSPLWASIYESLKQVVPWRRKQDKSRKMG